MYPSIEDRSCYCSRRLQNTSLFWPLKTVWQQQKYWCGKGVVVVESSHSLQRFLSVLWRELGKFKDSKVKCYDPRQDTSQVRNMGWRFSFYCCMNAPSFSITCFHSGCKALSLWRDEENHVGILLSYSKSLIFKACGNLRRCVYIHLSVYLFGKPLAQKLSLETPADCQQNKQHKAQGWQPESSLGCWQSQSERGEERDFL